MIGGPKVSIVMSVLNGAPFLRQAIDSILSQTLTEFELIIVDGGSTDGTLAIIDSYHDRRLRRIDDRRPGLPASLNRGISECRGALIARMDADDIAFSSRLAVQTAYLDANPSVDILCGDAIVINEHGHPVGRHRMGRMDKDSLLAGLLYRAPAKPIIHPLVIMRRAVPQVLGGYRDLAGAEDHDFWLRATERFVFASIRHPLLYYRAHAASASYAKRQSQAVCGIMNVVNYSVKRKTGIDIYIQRTDLFRMFSELTRRSFEADILPAETAFRVARNKLRFEGPLAGVVQFARAFSRYGPHILPGRSRRRVEKFCEALGNQICEMIAGEVASTSLNPAVLSLQPGSSGRSS